MKTLLLSPPSPRLMNPMTMEADMLPPKTWVPLGIASLASSLRFSGFEVEFHDLHEYEWSTVFRLMEASGADMVGISCFTFGRENALRTAAIARQALPQALVVMGGPHATLFPAHMLASGNVDVVVLGEGEITMTALATRQDSGGSFHDVAGLAYLDQGRMVRTAPRESVSNLDVFPFPDYDAFDLSQYKSPEIPEQFIDLPGTHVMTSRGCPFQCAFCSMHRLCGGKWSYRTPGNVAGELERLVYERGVRHVYFSDDLFTLRTSRTIGICKEILDRGLDIVWMAETRVDCVDEETLGWMRKAGCYRVYYGVESGSPRILESTNKGFTAEQVRRAFEMTHRAGLEPCCFLMVGNPGESPETIDETIELVREIRPATTPVIGITTILPGTEQYELAKSRGIIDDDYWLTDRTPPLFTVEQDEDDLIDLQMQLTRGICPEVYEQMCRMGFDENYFRMRRMTKALVGAR